MYIAYPARRPWYTGWWYLWVAIAIGMAAVWFVFFTGFLLTEEATETADVSDGFMVENDTEMNNGTALLNEAV